MNNVASIIDELDTHSTIKGYTDNDTLIHHALENVRDSLLKENAKYIMTKFIPSKEGNVTYMFTVDTYQVHNREVDLYSIEGVFYREVVRY